MNYKAGDKVSIKATVENVSDDIVRIYAEGYGERSFNLEYAPIEQKTYEQGLADAWELAKKIYDTTHADRNKIFGMDNSCNGIKNVFEMFTPQEALAKIEAYEKEKEIKVGDEVFPFVDLQDDSMKNDKKNYGVVTGIYPNMYQVLMKNGDCCDFIKEKCEKTGKHIDIEGILKQIGE